MKKIKLFIIPILIFLLFLEISSFVFIKFIIPNKNLNINYDVRLPLDTLKKYPYRNADFATEDLYKESFVNQSYLENGILQVKDYTGKWITYKNGQRTTTDSPTTYKQNVFIFGGSTIACLEVPDSYTVASYLQRKLNSFKPNYYKVHNLGYVGATIYFQNKKLLSLKDQIKPNDIIIYFDSFNDAVKTWLTGINENETSLFDFNIAYEKKKIEKQIPNFLNLIAFKSSYLNQALIYIFQNYNFKISDRKNDALPDETIKKIITHYREQKMEAKILADSLNAQFISFFQPSMYTLTRSLSPYENQISHLTNLQQPDFINVKYYLNLYLNTYQNDLMKKHPDSYFDLSKLFDSKLENEEFFIDFLHVSQIGNEIIADAMFNQLVSSKKLTY